MGKMRNHQKKSRQKTNFLAHFHVIIVIIFLQRKKTTNKQTKNQKKHNFASDLLR